MLENAIYSVITPEGCAAILFRDASKAPEAARALRLTAAHLLKLGVIDEIIPEPPGGAQLDPPAAACALREALQRHLRELLTLPVALLPAQRMEKFQKMGIYEEITESSPT